MKPFLMQPATDWAGHTNEERLLLCLEAVHVHDLILPRTFNQDIAKLRARAGIQREQHAKRGT